MHTLSDAERHRLYEFPGSPSQETMAQFRLAWEQTSREGLAPLTEAAELVIGTARAYCLHRRDPERVHP